MLIYSAAYTEYGTRARRIKGVEEHVEEGRGFSKGID